MYESELGKEPEINIPFASIIYFLFSLTIDADPDPSVRMFLSLLDSDSDPLVGGMDPDPDPSIIKQK